MSDTRGQALQAGSCTGGCRQRRGLKRQWSDSQWIPSRLPSAVSGGTFEFFAKVQSQSFPTGADNVADFSEWPKFFLERLLTRGGYNLGDGAVTQRLLVFLSRGIVLHSSCTGRMTPEVALLLLVKALKDRGMQLRDDVLGNFRGCDIATSSQQLMLEAKCHGPLHVFPSLQSLLPDKIAQQVAALSMKGKDEHSRAEAVSALDELLKTNRKEIFGPHVRKRGCLRHPKRACHVIYQDPAGLVASEAHRPLRIGVAGLPCQPYSRFGLHDPKAHPAMEAVTLGLYDMANSGFDVWFLENSDLFKPEIMEKHLPPNFTMVFIVFGPQAMPVPASNGPRAGRGYFGSFSQWPGPTRGRGRPSRKASPDRGPESWPSPGADDPSLRSPADLPVGVAGSPQLRRRAADPPGDRRRRLRGRG